ncbi:DUF6630 family protein [Duganella vulcania]|uniref:DUF6630 domain-containing protein n=1 Tax=Duganella vulcania TaxID=2692166 RepID=A0A845GM09_9BURK|nr:hypothetical protein [Duganella vulcania]MYM95613.1 hypothetical protein [Duganella vulcania]
MFKRLFGLISPPPAAPLPPPSDLLSDEGYARYKAGASGLTRLITRHLGEQESERLVRHVEAKYDSSGPTNIDEICWLFYDAMLDDEGQRRGQWFMLQVDWKASEEVAWQVQEMLAARGIEPVWQWDHEGKTVMQGLRDLSHWLASRPLSLLMVDYDTDSYYALIMETASVGQTITLGWEAGVKILGFEDFAATQGEE